MSMRLAHITATFPPYCGGTGMVCYHNARELARRGHDVHVFTAAAARAPMLERREDFTVHRLRPLVRVGNAPLLPGLLPALHGFEIIHFHYPFFGGEPAPLLAALRGTPLIVTYHQDVLLTGVMRMVEWMLRVTLGRMLLRRADQVLFTSHDYGCASRARPLLRGHEATIGELPNGVDTAAFTPGRDTHALRLQHHFMDSDRIVLLVASLDRAHYFKGVTIFLEALAQLPRTVAGLIVGDGDLRATYQAHAERLGLTGRVRFAGRVSDAALPDYYRLADVTVLPSVTMGEAFGLVLVESMACGTPVIATNLPGVRTVVNHGRTGLLIAPHAPADLAQAIRRILNDETARRAMGQRGRALVEARYGWEQIGARLETIYQQALDKQPVLSSKYVHGEE